MSPIIEVTGVRKSFGRHAVLNGVDLRIEPGWVVGLIGGNGTGKSTLIKCLLGLLRLDSGTSHVFGESSWDLSARSKARLGYVPQQVRLYPWMKVRHIVAYTGSFYQNWDTAFVEKLLDDWHLRRNSNVSTLSGGELQKLGLIIAMGHHPELLILDEPAAALDPAARREFVTTLLQPAIESQTVLFSTHILSDLERVASHVAFLHGGRIVLFDELDRLKERVKRVRISAGQDLPDSFKVNGALRTQVSGRNAMVAIPDVSDRLLDDLRLEWGADVAVEDLNLEEIFLELHDAQLV